MEISQPLIETTQNKWRRLTDLTNKERVFLVVTLITVVDEVILSIVKMISDGSWSSDVIISIVVFLNIVFCTLYAIEGVLTTRPSQLLLLSGSLIFLSLLLLGNYITGHHDNIKLAQMILVMIGGVALVAPGLFLAWKFHESKRLVTIIVGDSHVYQDLCSYLILCRDLFLFLVQIGASTILLGTLYNRNTEDTIFIFLGFAYLIMWSLFGHYMLKKESITGTRVFFVLSFIGLGLGVYGLIFAGRNVDLVPGIVFAIILSTVVFFTVVVGVIICAVKLYNKFGCGLAVQVN